jgi:hypothetical protein
MPTHDDDLTDVYTITQITLRTGPIIERYFVGACRRAMTRAKIGFVVY